MTSPVAGLWPVAITLEGVELDLADVLADVTIRHGGGSDPTSQAEPSSCQIVLVGVGRDVTKRFRVGGALTITAQDETAAPRFTGAITDARLENDELTLIGVGILSTLWRYTVGKLDYPAEPWSVRLARVFTEADFPAPLDIQAGGFDPTLAARPGAPTVLSSYLQMLLDDVGATACDLPDGTILVQTIAGRTLGEPLVIDPADVLYSPAWEQALALQNDVTVTYAAGEVTASDPGSIDTFGHYPASFDTTLELAVDAQTRANAIVARRSNPRWIMLGAPIIAGYQDVELGRGIELTQLPDSAPYPTWAPVLEGWEDRIDGPHWTMSLVLSDPLISGQTLIWDNAPDTWATIDQTVAWRDALTTSDLEAV